MKTKPEKPYNRGKNPTHPAQLYSCHNSLYYLQFDRIDPTNNNYQTNNNLAEEKGLTKTPQPKKIAWSTEHHHPWRSAMVDGKRSTAEN